MNRIRLICCSRCRTNYNVSDVKGSKVPMLLSCGHDMCRNCLKFMYKKNKKVICHVCSIDLKIICDEQLFKIPIHYYLVGKVWCLTFNKQKEIYRDIDNLRMSSLTSDTMKKFKKNCQSCHKCANIFCQQCNEAYCENCSKMVHIENQMMSHDLEVLDDTHLELIPTIKCDIHLKLIDFICITCQLQLCSICAIEDHRMHDIVHLEKYNMKTVQKINECSSKGEVLIKNLKHCRNELDEQIKKYSDLNLNNKNYKLNENKNNVLKFVSSLIGALQYIEQNTLDLLDQAESTVIHSLNNIINQLNTSIENLQLKLNLVDSLSKSNQCSSTMMSDIISEIERMLDTTYYIAQKNKNKSSIVCDQSVLNAIKLCINPNIDVLDTYLLKNDLDFPEDYKIQYTITTAVSDMLPPQRPLSSTSSVSTASNHSHSTVSDDVIRPRKFANFHFKEIVKGNIEAVIVSHVNSPSDFFLQLHANKNILKFVEDELNEFVLKNHNPVKCIEKNNVIYAVQRSNNQWYRATMLHLDKEENKIIYTMNCIDYGFLVTTDSDRIKNVPESISSIPVLAFNCTLYDLKPSSKTGWSNEAFKLFHDLILEKTGTFFVHPMNIRYERIEVDVVWNEYTYPLSIRNALFFLGHGTSDNYANKELFEKLLSMITLPPCIKLMEKDECLITISHFISPSEFFFRIDGYDVLLEQIMNTLQSIYKPTEKETHKSYLIYTPQIGMAVAARYSIDENWYRAKIISFPELRMVTVYYIDFGNSETLPWDQLRVLDTSLIKTPPLAIKAELADVRPAIDGVECTNWSEIACARFLELTQITNYKENSLSIVVHKTDDDTHKIILFNRTSRGEFCVNQKLVIASHAVTSDPELCLFKRENTRKLFVREPKPINSRNKLAVCTTDDTLEFTKSWSNSEGVNHTPPKDKNDKNIPGSEMLIVKVVSPDEITLKYADYNHAKLIDAMNKMYISQANKNSQNLEWKINDLCAVYIQRFGNWYRGKILKLDKIKHTATINFYDLNEINHGVPVDTIFSLNKPFVKQKCGILNCCLSNLIPLGTSDNQWPKFSCDRLIEKLKKYSSVYFIKTGMKGDIALGEIWVKEMEMPEALQPVREYWLNINRYMVEQGFAMNPKQNSQVAEVSAPLFESKLNESFDTIKHPMPPDNRWLPSITLDKSRLKALVTYVDYKGHLYFQNMESDSESSQYLKQIKDELECQFSESQPEPINVKWNEGQMVIANYHNDNCWYRASIVKKTENGEYSVQFIDYGNIETCSHENLRSTLYMTDIPQLCYKGFFKSISPLTEDGEWEIDTLDKIHSLIVDQPSVITIELMKSSQNIIFPIKHLKTDKIPDLCQFLVTDRLAHFNYVDLLNTGLLHAKEKSPPRPVDSPVSCINDFCDDEEESCGGDSVGDYDSDESSSDCAAALIEKSGYSKFVLKCNETIVGTVCKVVSPVQMTLMIKTIGGIDVARSKAEMETAMFDKCSKLPTITRMIPGTAVVVFHDLLWKRGVILDDGASAFLVDWGVSVNLLNCRVNYCSSDFYLLPMFSVNCQLTNVTANKDVDADLVVQEMSKLLRDVDLKIVWIKELPEAVGVELYNDAGEIAYQPLIDSELLIPK